MPKSGEVWCENARARLSPVSWNFDLDGAQRALNFATQFTPQYGDSFVEQARLQLLRALERVVLSAMYRQCQRRNDQICCNDKVITTPVSKAQLEGALDLVAVDHLDLKCANADPNYGAAWFECRHRFTDSARTVLGRARSKLLVDIHEHQHVYATAMARYRRAAQVNRPLKNSYASSDFLTGLINLSRQDLRKCCDKQKLSALFGSDFTV